MIGRKTGAQPCAGENRPHPITFCRKRYGDKIEGPRVRGGASQRRKSDPVACT
jgi:hypothetical protein